MSVICDECGKEFENEHGLNIHKGRGHPTSGKGAGTIKDPKSPWLSIKVPGKLTETEEEFYKEAKERGYEVYKNGWPDFFLVPTSRTNNYGLPFCVEVKKNQSKLYESQKEMKQILGKEINLPVVLSKDGNWSEPEKEFSYLSRGNNSLDRFYESTIELKKSLEKSEEMDIETYDLFSNVWEKLDELEDAFDRLNNHLQKRKGLW